jgi:hypothetical protein
MKNDQKLIRKIDPKVAKKEAKELIKLEYQLCEISLKFREIVKKCGIWLPQLALNAGNISLSSIYRALKGAPYNISLEKLMYIMWACGYDVQIKIVKRKQNE